LQKDNVTHQIISAAWPFKDQPPKRVVLKVGSNVLALDKGGLNLERITGIVDAIAAMKNRGIEVLLVSSGAVAAGRGLLGLTNRPTSIPELQGVAAIGQGALMEEYSCQFRRHNMLVAQMLLNRDDMDDRRRYLNARHALVALLNRGVVPIINENDSINIDELKFGDNDMLSAMISAKMDADLLMILSNVPGLMTGHPTHNPDAKLIPVVEELTAEHEQLVKDVNSNLGTGGMKTKLEAARHATEFGVTCCIVDGMRDGKVERVMTGQFEGTLFLAKECQHSSKKSWRHWLTSSRPKGGVVIDAGAAKALQCGGSSLLAVGIRSSNGDFSKGDVVGIFNEKGNELAHGIVNYDIADVEKIKGLKGEALIKVLGEVGYQEVVHRNNLALINIEKK
jgi:glutamate 5-kinase